MKTTSLAWLAGGALWVVAGVVHDGTYEAIWLAADVCIALGILGLWNSGFHAGKRIGVAGLALAALGRAAFIVAEIVAAASGNDNNALLPVGALTTAVGLTLCAVAALRARRLDRSAAIALLIAGVYPFAVMFPIVAATGDPSELAIALWGVPLGLFGAALFANPTRTRGTTVTAVGSHEWR